MSTRSGQSFVAIDDNLCGIKIKTTMQKETILTGNSPQGLFRVYEQADLQGPIFEEVLSASHCDQSGICSIAFKPIPDSKEKEYYFEIQFFDIPDINLNSCGYDCYSSGNLTLAGFGTEDDMGFTSFYCRTPMDTVTDGYKVIQENYLILTSSIILILGMGLPLTCMINRRYLLEPITILSVALGFGAILACICSPLFVIHPPSYSQPVTLIISMLLIVISSIYLHGRAEKIRFASALVAFCILIVLVITRMVFLSELIFPPYFDSAHHYLITNDLIHIDFPPTAFYRINGIPPRYYHFGFHLFSGWISSLSGANLLSTIPFVGQLFQVIAVLTVYFPTKLLSGSKKAGIAAVLFAGFGWAMPAFASNWGKYPAIFSAAILPTILGLIWITQAEKDRAIKRFYLWILLIMIIGAFLIHSRSIFVSIAAALSGVLVMKGTLWKRRVTIILFAFFLISVAVTISDMELIQNAAVIVTVFEKYWQTGGWIASSVIILFIPLCFRFYPTETKLIGVFSLFVLLFSIGPFDFILTGFFLDRPYLEIVMYIPFSIMGGVGVSSLTKYLAPRLRNLRISGTHQHLGGVLIGGLLIGVILIWGLSKQIIIPDSDYLIATQADLKVARWAQTHLAENDIVLIPTISWDEQSRMASDGGAWIQPFMNIKIRTRPHSTNLISKEIYNQLCMDGVTHVYFGTHEYSFSRIAIEDYSDLFIPQFSLPEAALYSVCNE